MDHDGRSSNHNGRFSNHDGRSSKGSFRLPRSGRSSKLASDVAGVAAAVIKGQTTALRCMSTASIPDKESPRYEETLNSTTNSLRACLVNAQEAADAAMDKLKELVDAGRPTMRKGHLYTLQDRIGPQPATPWVEHWTDMRQEHCQLLMLNDELMEQTADDVATEFQQQIDEMVSNGWKTADARTYMVLYRGGNAAIARALAARKDDYAAATYALSGAIFAGAEQVRHQWIHKHGESTLAEGCSPSLLEPPIHPPIYRNLRGEFSLSTFDQAWENITTPDRTNFRGVTSSAVVTGYIRPTFKGRSKRDAGGGTMMIDVRPKRVTTVSTAGTGSSCRTSRKDDDDVDASEPRVSASGAPRTMDVGALKHQASSVKHGAKGPIVRFDSKAPDAHGWHAAVTTCENEGTFPPNTLFTYKGEMDAGTWEAPDGSRPDQPLIIVSATYRPPRLRAAPGETSQKWSPSAVTLRYADRKAYVEGIDDIIASPALTMEQEFSRDMEWSDWKVQRTYKAIEEWRYVNGSARSSESGAGGRIRDEGHDGWKPQKFLDTVNAEIKGQACVSGDQQLASSGSSKKHHETDELLTMEEVLAIRLYSGPSFLPINTYLRQLAGLTGDFRMRVAQHPQLAFAATVGHIISGIRKLAAAAPVPQATTLYRAVRGEMPKGFWIMDEAGVVCATDMAFMSTSKERHVPIDYMDDEGANVLWQLNAVPMTSEGYHYGADISCLSQYGHEKEGECPPSRDLPLVCALRPPSSLDTQPTHTPRLIPASCPRLSQSCTLHARCSRSASRVRSWERRLWPAMLRTLQK